MVASAQERRHILPKDLPNAVKHLTDRELDLLIAASVEEAKRRGRSPPSVQVDEPPSKRSSRTDNRRHVEVATVSLTRGQVNAVRAAFKAGIKPSLIARQFGLSQSNVRKVLASDSTARGKA
jgi:predicted DNA binding protein